MEIGYLRVSSADQNTGRQLVDVPLEKTFVDKLSGRDLERPQLQLCLDFVREGDTLHVHSIDRLARNLSDLLSLIRMLTAKKVKVVFHKENLTFTGDDSPAQKLYLQLLGAMAEFERALIKERQREGIALAKQRGVYKGRKRSLSDDAIEAVKQRVAGGESISALSREYRVSRMTIYRCLGKA